MRRIEVGLVGLIGLWIDQEGRKGIKGDKVSVDN